MARMYFNAEITRRDYGGRSQLTGWVLDSGVIFHTTPEISGFIPGSLVETDKYIEAVDGYFVTAKQTG